MNYSSAVSAASSTSTSSSGSGGSTSGAPLGSLTARGPSHSRHHTTSQTSKTALQSLVRTKCWSIAPLWKFVTYELEQGPTRTNFTRSASVRSGGGPQRKVKISYENDMLQTTVPKRYANPQNHWLTRIFTKTLKVLFEGFEQENESLWM